MKKIVLALLICTLSATVYAQSTPKSWVVFGPAWLSAFEAKDIQMTDLGEEKTVVLDEGVTAYFYLDDAGNVTMVGLSHAFGPSGRYIKGVRQTIRTLLGKGNHVEELTATITKTKEDSIAILRDGVCFQQIKDSPNNYMFTASYTNTCSKLAD